MNDQPRRGISRKGLDAAFEADETLKSNLLLESELLRATGRHIEAAQKHAQAAPIEERLTTICLDKGLLEKAWVHWYSAVGCWARAGNYHTAVTVGEALLARPDLPARLRQHVENYLGTLRTRLEQWTAEPLSTAHERANGASTPTVIRDENTGETYLKVPIPEPDLVEPALKAVGMAMEGLRK